MRADPLPSVTPREIADRLARGESVLILDVREPEELRLARLPGTLDVPMGEIVDRLEELPRDREIVVMCHHGVRSAMVARHLIGSGFRAVNLAGGIDRWAREVDDSVRTY